MSDEKRVSLTHHSSLVTHHSSLKKELMIALLPSKRSPILTATCVTQPPQPAFERNGFSGRFFADHSAHLDKRNKLEKTGMKEIKKLRVHASAC
jgi:hypothetical protein